MSNDHRYTPNQSNGTPSIRLWSLGPCSRSERGQTTAEYALVLLAAATIAMLVVAWAGSGAIGDFFDEVMENITSMIA